MSPAQSRALGKSGKSTSCRADYGWVRPYAKNQHPPGEIGGRLDHALRREMQDLRD